MKHEEWNIGIIYEPIRSFLIPNLKPKVYWLPKRKDGNISADPFGVLYNNEIYVFFEDVNYLKPKGVISYIILNGTAPGNKPKPVLDLPFHVSYPYIFKHQGEIYCVPETAQAREISLYKCAEFPNRWQKVCTLIENIAGIDSTVFEYDDRWWLLCTMEGIDALSNLYIWHAPKLLGPWRPHRKNPVKKAISTVRPAGTPFVSDGYLYRPSQDCSKTYGGRIIINKIICLTPDQFIEEQVTVIEPFVESSYRDGIHTISAVDNMTLVDGKCIKFKTKAFLGALIRKFHKIMPI